MLRGEGGDKGSGGGREDLGAAHGEFAGDGIALAGGESDALGELVAALEDLAGLHGRLEAVHPLEAPGAEGVFKGDVEGGDGTDGGLIDEGDGGAFLVGLRGERRVFLGRKDERLGERQGFGGGRRERERERAGEKEKTEKGAHGNGTLTEIGRRAERRGEASAGAERRRTRAGVRGVYESDEGARAGRAARAMKCQVRATSGGGSTRSERPVSGRVESSGGSGTAKLSRQAKREGGRRTAVPAVSLTAAPSTMSQASRVASAGAW